MVDLSKKGYFTIGNEAENEYIEKKSVFISHMKPVEKEADAQAFIKEIKEKYKDASHNVSAYFIVGEDNVPIQHYNDDGEPGGTAGLPTLSTINKNEIRNVVIVTTRYFGGIMLGGSGLTAAYGKAASQCIQKAGIVEMEWTHEVCVKTEYHLHGKLQNLCFKESIKIKDTIFTSNVEMITLVPLKRYDEFEKMITECTNATAKIDIVNSFYLPK